MSIHPGTDYNSITFQQPLLVFSNVSLMPPPRRMTLTADLPKFEEPKQTKAELNKIVVPVPTPGLELNNKNNNNNNKDNNNKFCHFEEIVALMHRQAESAASQLDEIATSCKSGYVSGQNVFSPQEVMRFYHALPDEKKVSKSKRSKYRKYSLTTEIEHLKRLMDTSSAAD